MDQGNMNKFFNSSSFFTQTPQKDKQGQYGSTQQPSMFGQPQSGYGGMQNPFTQGSSSGVKSGVFGSSGPTSFGTGTPFGGAGAAPSTNTGMFGQSFGGQQPLSMPPSVSSQPQSSMSSMPRFGSSNAFGGASNIFGSTTSNPNTIVPTSSSFGTPSTTASSFAPQQSGIFGQSSQTQAPAFSMGMQSMAQPQQTSPWGQSSTASNPFGTNQSLFSNDKGTSMSMPGYGTSTGTRDHTYMQRKIREDNGGDVSLIHINGNEHYMHKSVEELRSEDYSLGRKPTVGGALTEPRGYSGYGGMYGTANNTVSDNRGQMPSTLGTGATGSGFQPFISTQSTPTQSMPVSGTSVLGQQTSTFGLGSSVSQPAFASQPSSTGFSLSQQPLQTTTSTNEPENPFLQSRTQSQPVFGITASNMQTSTVNPSMNTFAFTPMQQTQPMPAQQMFGTMNQGTQPQVQQGYESQGYVQQQKADFSDPFLVKNIKFEKAEKEHIPLNKVFPQPVFKEDKKTSRISLSFRPPKQLSRENVYTIPSIDDIKHMKEVHNLIIGFEDKGRIEYLDTVNASEVTMANIQSKVYFSKDSVVVNDPVGVGLNRRARVYVEGVFPYSRSLGDYIRGEQKQFPLKGIQERFVYGLKSDAVRKFVGYEYERGTYVYDVNHF
ncbi:nucleoporin autopeptidase domain-containing protein [Ordospora colligata]|uniref:Nucleoporin autopeptidase domain-containing protein n=1 Tax=Ordospora colligata OC4 TaxID=1354746 RepID=A0A0B2UGM7_9MICR|nr:nucleoporin autopeptidase domain-containing protein [Ordospora colligata OC4]KHN70211.1 nucleoporin autopeptidase domain-containing protein [Ordospora colligata OC4]TBU16755.1 nucleoporin autopeptidase domain-containing protein [Ordospora colligata]TBU17061.1 nucleoporin autopeptidase domain-containing protein [Ordospora colligata]TBU19304.1 nucleoporin autopeptidase domain-containing protein [Ordospora colligata]